ncbi:MULTISPECIES: hypothetical protein [Mammaliicoccus]|uniref:Transposase n=1 Tax=Mammaliicoccus lentus TaxID=42858 RepID=A0ABS6GV24_MAMLE|nr:hypothetical protein [Mammaliicoccus lentus]MBF0842251.1 hypothetical protein [Mammaliicoccus lentus]MBU6113299.1 hypothetical protein [Mammaliicoccus lentus]
MDEWGRKSNKRVFTWINEVENPITIAAPHKKLRTYVYVVLNFNPITLYKNSSGEFL